jgi:hypothetical protein
MTVGLSWCVPLRPRATYEVGRHKLNELFLFLFSSMCARTLMLGDPSNPPIKLSQYVN